MQQEVGEDTTLLLKTDLLSICLSMASLAYSRTAGRVRPIIFIGRRPLIVWICRVVGWDRVAIELAGGIAPLKRRQVPDTTNFGS
jgi:hypothetical protein